MATRYACINNTPYMCDYENNPINSNIILRVSTFWNLWNLKPSSFAAAVISISSVLQIISYLLWWCIL